MRPRSSDLPPPELDEEDRPEELECDGAGAEALGASERMDGAELGAGADRYDGAGLGAGADRYDGIDGVGAGAER